MKIYLSLFVSRIRGLFLITRRRNGFIKLIGVEDVTLI